MGGGFFSPAVDVRRTAWSSSQRYKYKSESIVPTTAEYLLSKSRLRDRDRRRASLVCTPGSLPSAASIFAASNNGRSVPVAASTVIHVRLPPTVFGCA